MTARLRDVPAGVAFRTRLLGWRGAVIHQRGHKVEVYLDGRHVFVSPRMLVEYRAADARGHHRGEISRVGVR